MKLENQLIDGIPALLWGPPTEQIIIAVHGDMGNKADAVSRTFAHAAVAAGYRVLSFDLPEHGDRAGGDERCMPDICVRDLRAVLDFARSGSRQVGLFACSIGAYFSLMAYAGVALDRCLFLSPVVDMGLLLGNMMASASVTEADLEARREIPTPMGKTLYWDYFRYVRDHPVTRWPTPTAVLCGERDEISEYGAVSAFCSRFGARMTVVPGGEHFFHTDEHMGAFRRWAAGQLPPCGGVSSEISP